MSELYGTTYRDRARPQAISAAQLLGQVMFLVAIALAFAAFGTWVGRDLTSGRRGSSPSPGSACCSVVVRGRALRVGAFAMAWLFATALVIGLGLGPVIELLRDGRSVGADAGRRAAPRRRDRRRRHRLLVSKDLAPWMRPLSLVIVAAAVGTSCCSLAAPRRRPSSAASSPVVSTLLIVVDFNYLRKHGTERDAVWLATGIFVSIMNIFISLLNIFSSR